MKYFTIIYKEGETWPEIKKVSEEDFEDEGQARKRFAEMITASLYAASAFSIVIKSHLVKGGKIAEYNQFFPY